MAKLWQNILLAITLTIGVSTALAQATIPVSGVKVLTPAGTPVTGSLVFTVTDDADNAVTYTPQGGSPSTAPITVNVVNGAVQNTGGFQPTIPNPATMSPTNTRYRIVSESTGGTVYYTLPLTAITQPFFSYDAYVVAPGVTVSGAGTPRIACSPTAMYNDTTKDNAYPWVCSSLPNNGGIYWTQNPSLSPSCADPTLAVASSIGNGTIFCLPTLNAYATPGLIFGSPASGTAPNGPVALIPNSGGGGGAGVSSINGRTGAITGVWFYQGQWSIANTYSYGDVVSTGAGMFLSVAYNNVGNIPSGGNGWVPFVGNIGQLSGPIYLQNAQFYGTLNVNDGSTVNTSGKSTLFSTSITSAGDQLTTQATIIQKGNSNVGAGQTWSAPGQNSFLSQQVVYYYNTAASTSYYDQMQELLNLGSLSTTPTGINDVILCTSNNPSGCLPRTVYYEFPTGSSVVWQNVNFLTQGNFDPQGGIANITGFLYGNGTGAPTAATNSQITTTINSTPCVLGSSCTISGGGGSTAWSALTSGTNTTMAGVLGSGASLSTTGSGTIAATSLSGTTPWQIYPVANHAGLTMDDSVPNYGTETYGNVQNTTIYQNGLYDGDWAPNANYYMIGDMNGVINRYADGRGGSATPSDEGWCVDVICHAYWNGNGGNQWAMWGAVVTTNTPIAANGPAAVYFSQSQGSRTLNSTMLIDTTSAGVQTNTITSLSRSSSTVPYTATVSTAVSVSTSATLVTDLCNLQSNPGLPNYNTCQAWTVSLDPQPALKSFTVATSTALTVGTLLQFVDTNSNLAEQTRIITAGALSGGQQALTAYLVYPHIAGAQIYAGGMVGHALTNPADTPDGQLYAFHIYGSPTSTSLLVGDRCIPSAYCYQATPQAVNIYPSATIISNITPGSGTNDGTYSLISPALSGAFLASDTVVNPGFASITTFMEKHQIYLDDPYSQAQGIFYNLSGRGWNWTNGSSAFWNLQFGFGNGTGQAVDLLAVSGNNLSVGAGFDFPSQLAGSHYFPSIGPNNCFFCISAWDTTDAGAPTTQDIFRINGTGHTGVLTYYNVDNTLRYNGHTMCDNSGNCNTGTISGLTAGYIPVATGASSITSNSHIDDGVSAASTLTGSEPFADAYGLISAQNTIPALTTCNTGLTWIGVCILLRLNNPLPVTGSTAYTNILTASSEVGSGNGNVTLASPGSININGGSGEGVVINGNTFDGAGNLNVGAGITAGQLIMGRTLSTSGNITNNAGCSSSGIAANSWFLDQHGNGGICDGTTEHVLFSSDYCASSASPAACGANLNGFFVIAAAATTATVNTTSVGAASLISIQEDDSLGSVLGVTCNTTADGARLTARVVGTSFTVTAGAAPSGNPNCYSYTIVH